jgi:lathosterol oxidase
MSGGHGSRHLADATLRDAPPEFRFGDGKISGVLSVLFGWLALGGVVALHFPQHLSSPDLRVVYPPALVRLLIDVVLAGAILLGALSLLLSRRKSRGLIGLSAGTLALLLGGSRVPVGREVVEAPYVALDWFLLSLLGLAVVFVPLERLFGRVDQRVFRPGWRTDLTHFGVSHLLVQVTVFLATVPAAVFFRWAVNDRFQAAVAAQPLWLQFVEALFVADLFAYVAHRLFHEIPFLWRFHQIHHSSEQLDWLAGSRLHVVDVIVTRAFGFVPLYVLGFANSAIVAYLVWASFQGVLIHSNLRLGFGPLRFLLATPQFHHWHHSATLYDKNFAVHLPLIDKIFGTYHLPGDDWPEAYGIRGRPVPDGYLAQLAYPLSPGRRQRGGPESGGPSDETSRVATPPPS